MPDVPRPDERPSPPPPDASPRRSPAAPDSGGPGGFDVGAAAAVVRATVAGAPAGPDATAQWDLGQPVPDLEPPPPPADAEPAQRLTADEGVALEPLVPEPEPEPVAIEQLVADDDALPLEPLPPDGEAAAALEPLLPPHEAAPAAVRVPGAHRVVVHTADGQVRRGVVIDAVLGEGPVLLRAHAGAAPEPLAAAALKAIFFMLEAGQAPPTPAGRAVRVTFTDGRELAGTATDDGPDRPGFFLVPADPRTRAERVWICRGAIRAVTAA